MTAIKKAVKNKLKITSRIQPAGKSTALTAPTDNANQNYAQFICNSKGKIEHVVMHVDDWERLAKLDPVYQAKNKKEGLQLNVILEGGKMVRLPHAVAIMVLRNGYSLLKSWRLFRGYKQSDFGEHGIAQPTMFQMEKATKSRISTLENLSEVYGCDIDQLASYVVRDDDVDE